MIRIGSVVQIVVLARDSVGGIGAAGRTIAELEETAKAAAKQYHDVIRHQKKKHAHNDNMWKAVKYLKSGDETAFVQVPQLVRRDGTFTSNHGEQAEELSTTFFPPLLEDIEDEGSRSQRAPVRNAFLIQDPFATHLYNPTALSLVDL